MVSPRLPYQVQTADMFPPTNNKKASLCPNLKPQTHKHHWQALLRHHQPLNLSRDLLLWFSHYFFERKNKTENITFVCLDKSDHWNRLFGERTFNYPPRFHRSTFKMTDARCRNPPQVYGRSWGVCDLWSSRAGIVEKLGYKCQDFGGYFLSERIFFLERLNSKLSPRLAPIYGDVAEFRGAEETELKESDRKTSG